MWESAAKRSKLELSNRFRSKKIVLVLSRKSSPNSRVVATESTKWASHTADAPMQRARRLTGRTALGRFTLSSSTTLTDACDERSGCYNLCCGLRQHRFVIK